MNVERNPYQAPISPTVRPVSDVRPLAPSVRFAGSLCCILPLLSYVYAVLFWLLASLTNEDWVQPSIDDPADFGFGIPLMLHGVMLIASFAVLPVVCAIGYRSGQLRWHLLVYAICLFLSITLYRLDLYEITMWIAD